MIIAIFGIALTGININTALQVPADKRDKSNFTFSIIMLVIAVIGLGVAGWFTLKTFKAPSPEVAHQESLEKIDPTLAKVDQLIKKLEETTPSPQNFKNKSQLGNLRAAQAALGGQVAEISTELAAFQTSLSERLESIKAAIVQGAQQEAAAAASAQSGLQVAAETAQ